MRSVITSARSRVNAGRQWWAGTIGGHGYRRMRQLNLDTHALALCAQQVLCTAPLIVAVSAVQQRWSGRGVGTIMARLFGLHGEAESDLESLFVVRERLSPMELAFGLAVSVAFAASVAASQQRGFELIWELPRVSGPRAYLRQLVWAGGLTVYSTAILLAWRGGRAIETAVPFGWVGVMILQGALTLLFYWWTQHILLAGRVGWGPLLPGAVVVAAGTMLLVRVSRLILPAQIRWQVDHYGLIGAVFLLSVWVMILSSVVYLGALLGALVAERRGVLTVVPPEGADGTHADVTRGPDHIHAA